MAVVFVALRFGLVTMNLVDNFADWPWWKIFLWLLCALTLAFAMFAGLAGIWWAASWLVNGGSLMLTDPFSATMVTAFT